MAHSHSPLRHTQFCRTICGRGYERQAFSGVTFSPHSVIILEPDCGFGTGDHAAALDANRAAKAAIDKRIFMSHSTEDKHAAAQKPQL